MTLIQKAPRLNVDKELNQWISKLANGQWVETYLDLIHIIQEHGWSLRMTATDNIPTYVMYRNGVAWRINYTNRMDDLYYGVIILLLTGHFDPNTRVSYRSWTTHLNLILHV